MNDENPKRVHLRTGPEQPSRNDEQLSQEEEVLRETVDHYLPSMKEAVTRDDADIILLHQDAFAAGYHIDEYTLLGMVIKYAGLYGREIMIQGKNRDTLKP